MMIKVCNDPNTYTVPEHIANEPKATSESSRKKSFDFETANPISSLRTAI